VVRSETQWDRQVPHIESRPGTQRARGGQTAIARTCATATLRPFRSLCIGLTQVGVSFPASPLPVERVSAATAAEFAIDVDFSWPYPRTARNG